MIFWKRKSKAQAPATDARIAALPEWVQTVYAIGDVHGMIALAKRAEQAISADPDFDPKTSAILYLGDLVDRGPESAFLLDWLIAKSRSDAERLFLCGNHEQMFLAFIADPAQHMNWLDFGGYETLNSYGILHSHKKLQAMRSKDLKGILAATIPESHIRLMSQMQDAYDAPGYFFAHAGVDPKVPLAQQSRDDLLWARHRFMGHEDGYEKTIVHGHTPVSEAVFENGRVSVDTGAYTTGKLSVAKISIEGDAVDFIVVTDDDD